MCRPARKAARDVTELCGARIRLGAGRRFGGGECVECAYAVRIDVPAAKILDPEWF